MITPGKQSRSSSLLMFWSPYYAALLSLQLSSAALDVQRCRGCEQLKSSASSWWMPSKPTPILKSPMPNPVNRSSIFSLASRWFTNSLLCSSSSNPCFSSNLCSNQWCSSRWPCLLLKRIRTSNRSKLRPMHKLLHHLQWFNQTLLWTTTMDSWRKDIRLSKPRCIRSNISLSLISEIIAFLQVRCCCPTVCGMSEH